MTKLIDLRLSNNNISDLSFNYLTRLKKLQTLYLEGTGISKGKLMRALHSFSELKELSLFKSSFIDKENLLYFSVFTSIRTLDLSFIQVAPKELESLGNIKHLYIYDEELDPVCLDAIKRLTNLSSLGVSKKVSEYNAQELRKALPKLQLL